VTHAHESRSNVPLIVAKSKRNGGRNIESLVLERVADLPR
jgi:hypothetical protein